MNLSQIASAARTVKAVVAARSAGVILARYDELPDTDADKQADRNTAHAYLQADPANFNVSGQMTHGVSKHAEGASDYTAADAAFFGALLALRDQWDGTDA